MNLRHNLNNFFSLTDLKAVCQDIGPDFEALPEGGKPEKVLGLIDLMQKQGRLGDLVIYLIEERPDLEWPDPAQPLTATDVWGPPERTPHPFEPEFVFVQAGPFLMGAPPDSGRPPHESPQHEVTLAGFHITRMPITNAQYAAYVKQTKTSPPPKVGWFGPNPPRGKESHPVVGVSWQDALGYCAWLTDLIGRTVRLPTEAEWEKAARGTDGRRYPWGNEFDPARCNPNAEKITAADAFPDGASPYGCLDMIGNAAEWTSTLWGGDWRESGFPYPYNPLDGREEPQAGPPSFRIFRGNAFGDEPDADRLCCSSRSWYAPDNRDKRRGFRVVMEL